MIRKTILFLLIFFRTGWVFSQPQDLDELIRKIDTRSKSYKEYHKYTASVLSVQREMDDAWKPKKVTSIEKQISKNDSSRTETITRASEIQDGRETDITAKILEKQEKQKERAKSKNEPKKPSKQDGKNQSLSLGQKELFPFAEEERKNYTFIQKPDTVLSGHAVLYIQTQARDRQSNKYEGSFFVDSKTYDILCIDVLPVKNPKFVKNLRIRMAFEVLPGDYWMFKSIWMRVYAGILIKKVRMEVEETYSNFTINS